MTPEQRATRCLPCSCAPYGGPFNDGSHFAECPQALLDGVVEEIKAAITEAVAEQKERCAKIAEAMRCGLGPVATPMDVAYADGYSIAGDNIAAAIRATP